MIRLIVYLLNVVYPRRCILCRKKLSSIDTGTLCNYCTQELENYTDYLTLKEENKTKLNCPFYFLFPYVGAYRESILRWKYRGVRKYGRIFGKLLVSKYYNDMPKIDAIIPIPLAPSRLKKRGFNQAEDLAHVIGRTMKVKVDTHLVRTLDTKPQAICLKEERAANIRGSMIYLGNTINTLNHIVIVDDIYTTGSTIKEAIRTLKEVENFKKATFSIIVVANGEI